MADSEVFWIWYNVLLGSRENQSGALMPWYTDGTYALTFSCVLREARLNAGWRTDQEHELDGRPCVEDVSQRPPEADLVEKRPVSALAPSDAVFKTSTEAPSRETASDDKTPPASQVDQLEEDQLKEEEDQQQVELELQQDQPALSGEDEQQGESQDKEHEELSEDEEDVSLLMDFVHTVSEEYKVLTRKEKWDLNTQVFVVCAAAHCGHCLPANKGDL
ncbi:hypothetical protein K525DRAFT_252682 [Schizophyllum commune Loenen D]|nr:hypothetical protein K525DRAFT_252682 [Schizophyllum commune Loenen D]